MKLKRLAPWKKHYDQPRQHIKKQRHYFANKGPSSQSYGFSSSLLWIELDCKESWAPKNWCFWTVVLKKTLESPLSCKEIQPVHHKGNQSWIFTRKTDAKAETPILWLPDAKNWLIWKDTEAENNWRQEEKGMTEDEMVGWHHRLDGHEFEQVPRVGDWQGSLMCCKSMWSQIFGHNWAIELNWNSALVWATYISAIASWLILAAITVNIPWTVYILLKCDWVSFFLFLSANLLPIYSLMLTSLTVIS